MKNQENQQSSNDDPASPQNPTPEPSRPSQPFQPSNDNNYVQLSAQIAKKYTPKRMTSLINQGKLAPAPVCTNCTWRERIAQTAELLAWGKKTSYSTYHWDYSDTSKFKKWSNLKGAKPNPAYRKATDALKPNHGFTNMYALGADCGVFVGMVVRYSGFDRKSTFGCPTAGEYYANSKNWKKVSSAKRGDVCLKSGCHTLIYLGNNTVAEANHFGQNFGHIASGNCKGYNVWRVDP